MSKSAWRLEVGIRAAQTRCRSEKPLRHRAFSRFDVFEPEQLSSSSVEPSTKTYDYALDAAAPRVPGRQSRSWFFAAGSLPTPPSAPAPDQVAPPPSTNGHGGVPSLAEALREPACSRMRRLVVDGDAPDLRVPCPRAPGRSQLPSSRPTSTTCVAFGASRVRKNHKASPRWLNDRQAPVVKPGGGTRDRGPMLRHSASAASNPPRTCYATPCDRRRPWCGRPSHRVPMLGAHGRAREPRSTGSALYGRALPRTSLTITRDSFDCRPKTGCRQVFDVGCGVVRSTRPRSGLDISPHNRATARSRTSTCGP